MSQERMEWARQVADAWERGDMEAVEALIEGHVEPDAELDPLYLDRVYTADEARQLWADMSETWEDYRSKIEEIIDLGEHLLVVSHITARGARGGVPVDQRIYMLCRFRGEKLASAKSFASRHEALDAAGLRISRCRRTTSRLFGRANEAFDARDMDALLAEHHPHVEIVVLRSEIEGPYRGHEGLRRMSADNFEANVEVRIDEIRDCGDRVLVLGHQHATLRGARWDHVLAEVYELEDGKITRMQAFPTIEDASKPPGCGSSRCRRRAHDGWSITHDA